MHVYPNTDAILRGIAAISTNARLRRLYGQQSQAHSTHLVPFGTRLKNTLRLNRDQVCIRQPDALPMTPWRRRGYQLQNPEIAVVKALGNRKVTARCSKNLTIALRMCLWAQKLVHVVLRRSVKRIS